MGGIGSVSGSDSTGSIAVCETSGGAVALSDVNSPSSASAGSGSGISSGATGSAGSGTSSSFP